MSEVVREGDRIFYFSLLPGAQLRRVEWRDLTRPGEPTHVLVDPDTLGQEGGHAGIDNFAIAPGGKLAAYNLSRGGAEITEIHLREVDTGKELPDVVPRVWGEFQARWLPDGSGFFYTPNSRRANRQSQPAPTHSQRVSPDPEPAGSRRVSPVYACVID